MPYLPGYQQQTNAGGAMQPYAPSPVPESGAVAQGLGALAQGIESAESGIAHQQRAANILLQRQKEEDAKSWAGNAVPDLAVKFDSLFEDMKSKAQGPATGFTPEYLSKFDDTAKATLALAPDDASRKFLQQHLQSQRASLGQRAVAFEASATRDFRIDQAGKATDNWATIVARDPSQYDTAAATIDQTLPDVGPEARTKLREKALNTLQLAAAGTAVQKDPNGTFRAINQALNIPTPIPANPFKMAQQVQDLPRGVQGIIGAIYGQESNSGAVDTSQPNYGGARGPMQVTEATFNGLKANGSIPKDARWDNPDDSAMAGVVLIKQLWSKYDGNPQKVAAAYYAGEKAVNADGSINDFKDLKNSKAPSTLQYVSQVTGRLGRATAEPLMPLEQVDIQAGQPTAKTGIGWIDAMSPAELLHYRQQAFTEMGRTSALAKHGLERTEKDIQAMALQGQVPQSYPSRDAYVAAFGPVEGVIRYKENVTDTMALGQSISLLGTASPEDRQRIIASATPVPGDGFADAAQKRAQLQHANDIIQKQLKDDPAIYVSKNSPRVRSAFNDLQAAQAPGTPPEVQAAARDRYAAESIAEQQRLGAKVPQLLTDDQAAKIALRFQDQKEGASNSAKLIDELQKQWGPSFPTIFRQLQKDDKLSGDVLVIPSMKDAAAKEQMARLALVPDKDLKARLAPGDEKDLNARLLSTMEPFWNTLAMQRGGEKTYGIYKQSTERLAMSYMAQGKSANEAAKLAFDNTVGHGYQFESTYRVPKAEMPDQVTQGANGITRHLEDLPLTIPPGRAGISPEETRKQYLDAVRTNALFITNADETGLVLAVKAANGISSVTGPSGPISFTWKQLRDEYQSQQGRPFVGYAKP